MSEAGPKRPNLHAVPTQDADSAEQSALAQRIFAREPAAEDALVSRYRSGLVSLLRLWTGDRALAEDLAHETLMVAIERLRSRPLDEPSRLAAFLRGTARNLAQAKRRREARQRTSLAGDQIYDMVDGHADPLAAAAREQESQLVRRLISELRVPRDRELLYRYYVADEPAERICADLGLDAAHLHRVLHRARTRLRELLAEAGEPR